MQQLTDLINDIKEEKNGFRFGELWKYWPYWFYAIIRPVSAPCEYYVLPEVADQMRFSDSGSINGAYVQGLNKPVLALAGSSLEGMGSQSRGIQHNIIIPANEENIVDVKCINAPHRISTGSILRHDSLLSRVRRTDIRKKSQTELWSGIYNDTSSRPSYRCNFTSDRPPYSDYVRYSRFRRSSPSRFYDFLRHIQIFQDQVGFIPIHDTNGVEGFEVFSHPNAFKHQYKDLFGSYVESIDENEDKFTMTPEKIKKQVNTFLDKILSAKEIPIKRSDYRRYPKSSLPKPEHTWEVEADGYNGELTRLKSKIIYCFLNKK
jgi:hypothetical protein